MQLIIPPIGKNIIASNAANPPKPHNTPRNKPLMNRRIEFSKSVPAKTIIKNKYSLF